MPLDDEDEDEDDVDATAAKKPASKKPASKKPASKKPASKMADKAKDLPQKMVRPNASLVWRGRLHGAVLTSNNRDLLHRVHRR